MTLSFSEIADALRWVWVILGIVWVAYAWLHRIEYWRVLLGLGALLAGDWLLHAFADFAEQPNSNIPTDFASYSLAMLLAAIIGLSATCLYARWRGMNVTTVLSAALVCVLAGGIGGRVYQVLTNWHYYAENTDLISELPHGGFGIRGALLIGFLVLFIFATLTKNSFWKLADAAVIGLALAQSIGWYGAHLTHVYYGIALDPLTSSGQALASAGTFTPLAQFVRQFGYNFVQLMPDAYNLIAFRIPVQMMYALFFFALFLFLLVRAVRHPDSAGSRFIDYWLLVTGAGFLFGFWRGDETLMWQGLRADQWIDLAFFVFGIALWWLQRAQSGKTSRRILQQA